MITRLVKMHFEAAHINDFLEAFDKNKDRIRHFPGCRHLELWEHEAKDGIFFTFSKWDSLADLERYRESDLFRGVWTVVKKYFAEAPQAWSVSEWTSNTR